MRLGIAEDQPLAVQQWSGLIAINYPARKYGVKRFTTISEAKKLCPDIILQHVATWKEGDERWAYHRDAFAHMGTHKVSLDPYRLESRRILACIKDILPPPPTQRVEKASIDEVFLDLSAQIHSVMLHRYPELNGPAPYDDPTECLPRPPTTALDWNTDALVDLDSSETEDDDPDWDDIAMLIGSEIVRAVRAAIRERLKYTCSAGVARNKMLAKLGSAHKKPNQQTIVRNRAVQKFLGEIKITSIRNLGGKLGEEVLSKFATEEVKELLPVSIELMKSKLGDDTGSWVYHIVRGDDFSEVNSRTQIKSMLSAKSFRPSINTVEEATRWLRIFVADIYGRLVEEGVIENKRRPKTINLHHRQGGQMRSRQGPIPSGRPINEVLLFDIAQNLLGQIVIDGRCWPCSNLQLSVGGFEDGPTNNRGIGGFLVRGDEAKAMMPTARDPTNSKANDESDGLPKRQKLDNGAIQKFLIRSEASPEDGGLDEHTKQLPVYEKNDSGVHYDHNSNPTDELAVATDLVQTNSAKLQKAEQHTARPENGAGACQQASNKPFICTRCGKSLLLQEKEEHEDWHFAKTLQARETSNPASRETQGPGPPKEPQDPRPTNAFKKASTGRPSASNTKKIERGQKRLAFS